MSVCEVKFTIRQMKYEDIKTCLDIWREIGLNEGHQTVISSFKADPEGFYVAIKDGDSNEIIGMCSGCMARPDTAFMGFYAVRPKYQKLGIGQKLWSQTMARLKQSSNAINIGLYGVDKMYKKYKEAGFDIDDPTSLCIFECDTKSSKSINLDTLKSSLEGHRIEKFDYSSTEEQFKKLVEYDHGILHCSREKLLRLYLKVEDAPLTLLAIRNENNINNSSSSVICCKNTKTGCGNKRATIPEEEDYSSGGGGGGTEMSCGEFGDCIRKLKDENDDARSDQHEKTTNTDRSIDIISGYGCIRADNTGGCMIGPIYADNSDIAEMLLRNLIERYTIPLENPILGMCLTANKQAFKILTKAGFHEAEQCRRLFTKFIPSASLSKIYYIHSPNFSLF